MRRNVFDAVAGDALDGNQFFALAFGEIISKQSRRGQQVARDALEIGDLVFYNTQKQPFSHVGIYIGDNKFVHAPSTGSKIRVDDMRASYWVTRYNGARRIDETAGT